MNPLCVTGSDIDDWHARCALTVEIIGDQNEYDASSCNLTEKSMEFITFAHAVSYDVASTDEHNRNNNDITQSDMSDIYD